MRPLSSQEAIYLLIVITLAYFGGFHVGKRTEREDAAEKARRNKE